MLKLFLPCNSTTLFSNGKILIASLIAFWSSTDGNVRYVVLSVNSFVFCRALVWCSCGDNGVEERKPLSWKLLFSELSTLL